MIARKTSVYLIVFAAFAAATSAGMLSGRLSDDQILYWTQASVILEGGAHWTPASTFSYLLAGAFRLTNDVAAAFALVYAVTAFLYLCAMRWCLSYFLKDDIASLAMALVSIVPYYTLGMTYWGFAGFEFIRARILIMPLVPLVVRFYFANRGSPRIWFAFVLCALGAVLNFEAVYLLLILALYSARVVFSKSTAGKVRAGYLAGISVSFVMAVCIVYLHAVMERLLPGTGPFSLYELYGRLHEIYLPYLNTLTDAGYLELYWQAAREAFWWTLFPPRIADAVFAFANTGFLILFAFLGARHHRRACPAGFGMVGSFFLCVLAVAYGYQAMRFCGWKLFMMKPDVLEEVRAVKFIFLPLYFWAGHCLVCYLQKGARFRAAVAVGLMIVSPLAVLRSLPEGARAGLAGGCARVLENRVSADYCAKAFGIRDEAGRAELESIIALLRQKGGPRRQFVLSDLHEIKRSGHYGVLSYQDKRSGQPLYFLPGSFRGYRLPVWYLAYSEAGSALRSGDGERITETAEKFGCDFIVAEVNFSRQGWAKAFEGQRYFLYVKGDGL